MNKYIKQVSKELSVSRKRKKDVIRDLEELFDSALENGETEQQLIERLGPPQEFAKNIDEQFGVDRTEKKKKNTVVSVVVSLAAAAVAFIIYAVSSSTRVPSNAIGYAESTTQIKITGDIGIDLLTVILVIGFVFLAVSLVQIVRMIRSK